MASYITSNLVAAGFVEEPAQLEQEFVGNKKVGLQWVPATIEPAEQEASSDLESDEQMIMRRAAERASGLVHAGCEAGYRNQVP